jgi:hypothetical protein
VIGYHPRRFGRQVDEQSRGSAAVMSLERPRAQSPIVERSAGQGVKHVTAPDDAHSGEQMLSHLPHSNTLQAPFTPEASSAYIFALHGLAAQFDEDDR